MHVTGKLTRAISPARQAAFAALEAADQGAYASDILREETRDLTARDAGLAAQIVFGTLRFRGQLRFLIEHYSGRPSASLDAPVLRALESAIFQVRYLERIPPHAAVGESVEYVKARKRAATGFVNAVLRKLSRAPVGWPDEATELSAPNWLLERWSRHFGREVARGIAAAALEEPVAFVRRAAGAIAPSGVELTPTAVAGAYRVLAGSRRELRLHDIGSQSVIPQLGLRPGMSFLDLCAAPGNKTLQACEIPLGLAVACDISERRLREVPAVCPRVVLDASEPLPFSQKFDRVFIDAPCSGTGTLARNPEIKWRLEPAEFIRFQDRQIAILERSTEILAPGGKILYATCSLEEEENERVIEAVMKRHPGLIVEHQTWRLPGRDDGDGFYSALLSQR